MDAPPATVVERRWHPIALLATFLLPVLVFTFAGILAARALGLRSPVGAIPPEELALRTFLVDVPLILATLVVARLLLRARPRDLGLVPITGAAVRYGVIFGVGLFFASIAIGLVQAAALGKEPQQIARALLSHKGPVALALDLFAVSILTPLAEELIFRGVLFAGLRQRFPFIVAGVLSTLVFTAVHEPQAWPGVFFLGFGLALAYERTRTLWAPIVSHAVVNGLPLLLLAMAP